MNTVVPPSAETLAQWRATCRRATPGPWQCCDASDGNCQCRLVWSIPYDVPIMRLVPGDDSGDGTSTPVRSEDWHFIAMAREAVPQLLDEVVSLRAIFEAVRELHAARQGLTTPGGLDAVLAAEHRIMVAYETAIGLNKDSTK